MVLHRDIGRIHCLLHFVDPTLHNLWVRLSFIRGVRKWLRVRVLGSRVKRFKGSRVQGFKGSRVKELIVYRVKEGVKGRR